MNADRWHAIAALFQAAVQREPAERSAYLAEACRGQEELLGEVHAMLNQPDETLRLSSLVLRLDAEPATRVDPLATGTRLGPYRIEAILGAGGMGQVYRAVDTRLGRKVAIKVCAQKFTGRFEREARAISALNHPHICTLYDVGALPSGAGYLVTELVEGETMRGWLGRAPGIDASTEIARQVLQALRAAHAAGIVHRDLKPENIMVRFDGYVKVLDFGLAKWMPDSDLPAAGAATQGLSVPGQILGTLAYMPPEQILGLETDARSDLFSFGIIVYEMLTGRRPWLHKSAVDLMHAIVHDDPAPIDAASPAAAWAPVVEKLLRKSPADRYSSAEAVLEAVTQPGLRSGAQAAPRARPPARLIVLPFRILRRHEESDFLAVSLPDAITSSLAAIDSIVVRSTMTASRFAAPDLDVKTIGEQAQVDAILTGTVLSDGENLRVNAQLVEAPDGALLWSHTSRISLRDIFRLQDELVDRIVQALEVPLTARERRALKHDVPASATAYEIYLRANQRMAAGATPQSMIAARDLYKRAVEADPKYAPAWACLGRAYRFLGKYSVEDHAANLAQAEDAFQKAFALNPDLPLAHSFYTSLQTDSGRSLDAMARLLQRAGTHRNDPNLLAGLVHACRYCDLLDASIAAHEQARRLDPGVRTSVAYTYLHLGDYVKALEHSGPTDGYVRLPALMALGRGQEAVDWADAAPWAPQPLKEYFRAIVAGDSARGLDALNATMDITSFHATDPEARFCTAMSLAKLNDSNRALEFLSIALDEGFRCQYALVHEPWFESLRSHQRFADLVSRAAAMSIESRTVFLDNGGDRLLEIPGKA